MTWQQQAVTEPTIRAGSTTRQRILAAAADLFSLRGVAGTTVKAIGARAGVSDAALYYYFTSKHAIFEACWDQGGLSLPPVSLDHRAIRSCDDAVDCIEALFFSWLEQEPFLRMVMREGLAGDAAACRYFSANWDECRTSLRICLTPLVGERAEATADLLSASLTGLLLATILGARETAAAPADGGLRRQVRAVARVAVELPLQAVG